MIAISTLVQNGAKVDIQDSKGNTPLFYAAEAGNFLNARQLLTLGANLNHTNKAGITARTHAFQMGRKDFVTEVDKYLTEKAEETRKAYIQSNEIIKQRQQELEKRHKEYYQRSEKLNEMVAKQQKQALDAEQQATELEQKNNATLKAQLLELEKQKKALELEHEKQKKELEEERKKLERARLSIEDKKKYEKYDKENKTERIEGPLTREQKQELQDQIRNLSYHHCAHEYWKYNKFAKMKTDYDGYELDKAIEEHSAMAEDSLKVLTEKFGASDSYIGKVIVPTEEDILTQLSRPITNAHRASEGIGKIADMEERCKFISDKWELVDGLQKYGHNIEKARQSVKKSSPENKTSGNKRKQRRQNR